MSSVVAELAEQTASNLSGLGHHDSFFGHRQHLTALALAGVGAESGLRLCVLGAGNCNDLDLARLAEHYAEIHLVDIDVDAVRRAVERQDEAVRKKLRAHAPLDLSGLVDRLERWKAFQVTPDELIAHGEVTSQHVARALGAPFDVVLSACVLTQMQLMVVNVLGDTHRLFEAVRHTLTLTHLRTLAHLLSPGGRALLATDVTSDRIAALGTSSAEDDLMALLVQLVAKGQIFQVAHPEQLTRMTVDDPVLARTISRPRSVGIWRWQNGPEHEFLVYAIELLRLL